MLKPDQLARRRVQVDPRSQELKPDRLGGVSVPIKRAVCLAGFTQSNTGWDGETRSSTLRWMGSRVQGGRPAQTVTPVSTNRGLSPNGPYWVIEDRARCPRFVLSDMKGLEAKVNSGSQLGPQPRKTLGNSRDS